MNEISIPTVQVEGVPEPLPESVVVLDVREENEWQGGHVDGAVHIPLGELPARIDELPDGKQVLAICHVGGRSAQATGYLVQRGYDAVNLDGGMIAWQRAGRPVV
ncbi:rhodanese-like domain-containing protein [Solicola gregarius]|uniref:Rhodanese-like domain-containing protein n=1 Tax=Solicola gregarius TaxID=2908642 RepID=A0AA46TLK2_9ACTN|nr:rhodanese-like domain-containing protein [Solicola gregarius]UYM07554.1 rhodanese-like domain-containing protein [Solicola gregarius]